MKFLKFLVILFFLMLMSCQQNKIPIQPEILTAEYEILTKDDFERGYNVFLEVNGTFGNELIKGIVLNHKLLNTNTFFNRVLLNENDKVEKATLDKYFPIHTQKIINFIPPPSDNRPNGIIFEIGGKEYFYEIEFKLK